MRESHQQESQNQTYESFSLEETNAIQMKLMEGSDDPIAWIDSYAESFRKLLEAEPQLHEQYEKDPDACVRYINTKLLH